MRLSLKAYRLAFQASVYVLQLKEKMEKLLDIYYF